MAAGAADERWMRAALGLARRALGQVAPNPAVAALLVRDGVLLGRGVTARGGRPHAEALAVEAVARAHGAGGARGATAYVTLEPCAHHGLTPPCAETLARAGIARLVCPVTDPDPRVAGRGFAHLREAGVEVVTGVCAAEARAVNAGFLSRIERGRPHLTLKLAATLDGRIATAAGESRWITGAEARLRVHLMRAASDAVMVGAGTARADDPMLDVRGFGARAPRPVRVVLDPGLTLAPGSRLMASAREAPVWLLHREDAEPARVEAAARLGARPLPCPAGAEGLLDPAAALGVLGQAGLTRVLCEGGGRLAAALLKAGLVDELALFTAGAAIGAEGVPALGPLGLGALAEAPRLVLATAERVGPDTLTLWRPEGV